MNSENTLDRPSAAEFIVNEWAQFFEGEERRKVQITEVNGSEVTARVYGKPMTFTPRPSDGKFVKKGSPDYEVMPTMIQSIAPKPPKSKVDRWKDVRDFLHGMFWAPR